jgi:hypothetical protein
LIFNLWNTDDTDSTDLHGLFFEIN